jgi:signal transduction histidine kinase
MLDTLDVNALMVDRADATILWATASCAAVHPALAAASNLASAMDLSEHIDWAAIPAEPGDWGKVGEWQASSGASSGRMFHIVAMTPGEPSPTLWLRLVESVNREDYFKQYLADLDQLFNTSRSVSVGEMATTIAHELNQPIGTLVNIVRGVKRRLNSDGEAQDDIFSALELAERQAQFAADILNRIRDFTQSRRPTIVECMVPRLLEDTVELLDWIFDSEGIEVELRIKDTRLVMHGDVTLLQQVLVNIFRNAVESMCSNVAGDKLIVVNAWAEDDDIAIDIVDRGHGLTNSREAVLFSPFVSNKPNGMGVGLNICRSIIELHHGRFWLSGNDDTGCTAHLRFRARVAGDDEKDL